MWEDGGSQQGLPGFDNPIGRRCQNKRSPQMPAGQRKCFVADRTILADEFRVMKHALWSKARNNPQATMIGVWGDVIASGHNIPRMLRLLYVSLCVPVQTACVERGFSIHRVLKTRLSNRMGILQKLVLDSLMRVQLICLVSFVASRGRPTDVVVAELCVT